jgi:hypothetical protein
MAFRLILLCLPVLSACAAAEDGESGSVEAQILHVNSANAPMEAQQIGSESGSSGGEPIMQVNAEHSPTVTRAGDLDGGLPESEVMDVHSGDVPTETQETGVKSNFPETEPVLEANSPEDSLTPVGDSQSGPPESEPTIQITSTDVSTEVQETGVQNGFLGAEPLPVNSAGEIEDVMTATPKGGFQNTPIEAEPTL